MMRVLLCLAGLFAFAAAHSCPPLWTSGTKGCYRFFAKPATWEDAKTTCQGFSSCVGNSVGNLVSIEDIQDNEFVKLVRESFSVAQPIKSVWIGLMRQPPANPGGRSNTFIWANGQPFSYQNWEAGQPNNQGGSENCVRFPGIASVDKWDDFDCLTALPYICHLYAPPEQPRGAIPPNQPRRLH